MKMKKWGRRRKIRGLVKRVRVRRKINEEEKNVWVKRNNRNSTITTNNYNNNNRE